MEINVNSKDCLSHCRENMIGSSPPRYRHPAPSHDHLSPSRDRLSPSRDHQTRPRMTIRTEEDEERPDSPDYSILGRDKQGTCVSTIYTLKEKHKRVFFSTNNGLFTLPDSNSDSDTGCKPNGKPNHTARSPIRIPILTANCRNLIGNRIRICICECK